LCQDLSSGHRLDSNDRAASDLVSTLLHHGEEAEETSEDGMTPLLTAVTRNRVMTLGELCHHQLDELPDYD
jgi:hypothetical protein